MTARERPILFSGAMVRAILDGQKSQTRRAFTHQPSGEPGSLEEWSRTIAATCHDHNPDPEKLARHTELLRGRLFPFRRPDGRQVGFTCPCGNVGDRLWVRETWFPDAPINGWPGCVAWNGTGRRIDGVPAEYRAPEFCLYHEKAAEPLQRMLSWRPSIHMPRWASRISLEITQVRVERIQNITNEDAIAEGRAGGPSVPGYSEANPAEPYEHFAHTWDTLNAKRGFGWDVNPWVWVIAFRRIHPFTSDVVAVA